MFPAFKSLALATMLKMALRVSFVVVLVSALTFWYLKNQMKDNISQQLSRYSEDQAYIENKWLQYLERMLDQIRLEFMERYQRMGDQNPKGEFDSLFEKLPDDTHLVRKKLYSGTAADLGQRIDSISGGLDKIETLTAERRLRLVVGMRMLSQYGPALVRSTAGGSQPLTPFLNLYFFNREKDLIVYWPNTPWYPDFGGGFDLAAQGDFTRTFDMNTPFKQRDHLWTRVYRDEVPKVWMVSYTIPIDIGGKNISALGVDLSLSELNHRLQEKSFPGTTSFIVDKNGYLIAHPHLDKELIAKAGNFKLQTDGDAMLKNVAARLLPEVKTPYVAETADGHLMAVAPIAAPGWFHITIYPESQMTSTASKTAQFVLATGLLSLVLELLMLWLVLNRNVAQPLRVFIKATQDITAGDLSASRLKSLPSGRTDELGALAEAFSTMANSLEVHSKVTQRITKTNRVILESSGLSIISTDEKGCVTSVNQQFEKTFGYDEADFVRNKSILSFYLDQDEIQPAKSLQLPIKDDSIDHSNSTHSDDSRFADIASSVVPGKVITRHWLCRHSNNRIIPTQVAISHLRDDSGKTNGYLLMIKDLSETASMQEQLSHFFDDSPDFMCIADAQARFLKVNKSLAKALGCPQQELIGQPLDRYVHGDDLAKTNAEVDRLAVGMGSSSFIVRSKPISKDGEFFTASWSSTVTADGLIYAVGRRIG